MKLPQTPPLHDLLELTDPANPEVPQHLLFHVEEELYALSLREVSELARLERLMPVPGLPPHFIGVINLRGNVVPIMDLQLRFGLAATPTQPKSLILICRIDDTLTGLLVNSITKVATIQSEAYGPNHPRFSAGEKVSGVATCDDALVAILNLEAVIDLPKTPPA